MTYEYVANQLREADRIKEDVFASLGEAGQMTLCCTIIDHLASVLGVKPGEIAAEITEAVTCADEEFMKEAVDNFYGGLE